ncbi:MAG: molybdopterin-guanine dinucleotide biosynthesis protein B [Nitrospirae bacterium]|nr:molybdopterin-guanine dinucleotide biosynthesis protein B [Nitrospirota bacterium]
MKKQIISICGAHSGCGKTFIAELLLRRLQGSWAAIKYTRTAFYTTVKESTASDDIEGKDTWRMKQAGAEPVLWVQAPEDQIQEPLEIALSMLSEVEGVIIEGNSVIEFLNPDVVIFVFGEDDKRIKESARKILPRADIVIKRTPDNFINNEKVINIILPDGEERLINRIEVLLKTDKKKKLIERIHSLSKDGRIPCPLARRLAEEEGISYKEIGDILNELKIKITNCELGCF